jgi:glc operon protein GlcG
MITRPALKLNWEGTGKIVQAAVKKAEEMGVPMSITVVDEGGHLLGFARTDRGKAHNIPMAIAKARSAAFKQLPTGKTGTLGNPLDDHMAIALTLAGGPENFVTFSGGFPILIEGQCVGGIGVSGGKGEQDDAVAEAGLDALGGAGC